jgi:hypothetical protein
MAKRELIEQFLDGDDIRSAEKLPYSEKMSLLYSLALLRRTADSVSKGAGFRDLKKRITDLEKRLTTKE